MSTEHPRLAATRTLIGAASAFGLLLLQGCDSGADTQPSAPPAQADTVAPTQPASLTALPVDADRVELNWQASTDAVGVAGYRIYRDGSQDALASVEATEYADTSVAASSEYTYRVRAFDAAGNVSEPSPEASVTTPAAPLPQVSGLDARPANTSCTAWPRPTDASDITLQRYTELEFTSPVAMLQAPNDSSRWFIVQQNGIVLQFSAANPSTATTFIDIDDRVASGGEMGLLGMAFHPDFPADPRVFLSYTTDAPLASRISAFTTSDSGATLDAASEEIVLRVDQPESNHNGGHIAFGADGYLYIGLGDGGGGGDSHGDIGNGQRLTTMLGKMLRIDVDDTEPYTIPSDNPFAGNAVCPAAGRSSGACPEIYALGFRNPWRWSFDRENGELWVADVGQGRYEEVDRVTRGGNYGWRCREGAHDFSMETPGCGSSTLIDPVSEYGRDLGYSITGGYVYRGSQATSLVARYLFADFGSGRIFAWLPEEAEAREPQVLLDTDLNISAFGEGRDGELYVVNHGGSLHRIVFSGSGGASTAPSTLSATHCVDPSNPALPASGLIPYSVNAPFWSDGADKERWVALPDGENITIEETGDWTFPNGTVLMKHFRLDSRLIETRLFMRHPDGVWGGFTYEWNAAQTDATLLQGGAERDVGAAAPWIFPSESQCMECHTSVAGRTLGLETGQLNGNHLYASTNRVANQLYTLNHIGMLTPPIGNPATRPVIPNPQDEDAPLTERARAYLHTNCSFCHRPGGPTSSTMDLRYTTALADTKACDANPQSGDLGIGGNARIIAPGNAPASVLVGRMNRRDEHAMPPLGSNQIDTEGVALITEWINGLAGCD